MDLIPLASLNRKETIAVQDWIWVTPLLKGAQSVLRSLGLLPGTWVDMDSVCSLEEKGCLQNLSTVGNGTRLCFRSINNGSLTRCAEKLGSAWVSGQAESAPDHGQV